MAVASGQAMLNVMKSVRDFHKAAAIPFPDAPCIPPPDRVTLRRRLHNEEGLQELDKAIVDNDLVKIGDGIGDLIYVLIGTALEYGIPLATIWQYICEANAAKINPDTGMCYRDAGGKVMKPPGWQDQWCPDPKIAKLLLTIGASPELVRL